MVVVAAAAVPPKVDTLRERGERRRNGGQLQGKKAVRRSSDEGVKEGRIVRDDSRNVGGHSSSVDGSRDEELYKIESEMCESGFDGKKGGRRLR